jgi:hypothetical protein
MLKSLVFLRRGVHKIQEVRRVLLDNDTWVLNQEVQGFEVILLHFCAFFFTFIPAHLKRHQHFILLQQALFNLNETTLPVWGNFQLMTASFHPYSG